MSLVVNPQPGEEVYVQREFRHQNGHVFAMAVSNQAVYFAAQKLVLKDPWYFKRVALADVMDVRLIKQKPIFILLLSLLMIVVGGLTSFVMLWYAYNPQPGAPTGGSGWPIAVFVGGLVIPFIARGRRTLVMRMKKGKFKWKPELALDKKTRALCAGIQDELLEACRKVGIETADSQ